MDRAILPGFLMRELSKDKLVLKQPLLFVITPFLFSSIGSILVRAVFYLCRRLTPQSLNRLRSIP